MSTVHTQVTHVCVSVCVRIKYVLCINNSIFIFTFVVSSHFLVTRKFNLFLRFLCSISFSSFFFLPPARFASLFDEPRNPISWRWRWRWRLTLKTMLTLKFDNAERGDTNWKLDSKLYLITNEMGSGQGQEEGEVGVEVAATIFCLVSFRVSSFIPFLFLDWTIDNQITSKCGYIERQSKWYTCVCVCELRLSGPRIWLSWQDNVWNWRRAQS